MNENIALMYLAEKTSPDDYKLNNLQVDEVLGSPYAEFDAVLHSFDVLNRNRRMYDGNNVMTLIRTTDRIQDYLHKNGWFGEMDHPESDFDNAELSSKRVQRIEMSRRSHKIMNPHLKGNLLVAKIQTSSGTECGIGMAREIIQGYIPGFSCRSIAVMKMMNGKPYVIIKKLITYDWVLYNSHREAEMTGGLSVHNGSKKVLLESVESSNGSMFRTPSKDVCIPMTEFADFRKELANKDNNLEMVLESGDYDISDISGIQTSTNNIIVENGSNKIYVNMNMKSKKKIEDFLLSHN